MPGQAAKFDLIDRFICYQVSNILSVFIGVISALIGGEKNSYGIFECFQKG